MKTKDLIRALNEADPEGDTEVNIGGHDVHFVEKLPGYYDGSYQVLLRNPALKPYYDISGVRICRQGWKVVIHTVSADEVMLNNPDALVQYDSSSTQNRYEEDIERVRQENKDVIARVDAGRDEEFEKVKTKILNDREDADIKLARFIRDVLTKNVHSEFGQTLGGDGRPFNFDLPNLPDARAKLADEIFSAVWTLLGTIDSKDKP